MDTSDRPDSTLPARSQPPLPSSLMPPRSAPSFGMGREVMVAGAGADMVGGSARRIDPISILRGLARNWWKILGIWLAASAPLIYLIYTQVKPTYTAYSVIRLDSLSPELYRENTRNSLPWIDRTMETEVSQITDDTILNAVVADPNVVGLPIIKNSNAPVQTLKDRLIVANIPKTDRIRVSLESNDPVEAANVVNAVVQTYVGVKTENGANSADTNLIRNLTKFLDQKRRELEEKEKELLSLTVVPERLAILKSNQNSQTTNSERFDPNATVPPDLSQSEYQRYRAMLLDTEVKLIEAKLELSQRLEGFEDSAEIVESPDASMWASKEDLEQRVTAEFYRQPDVVELIKLRRNLEDQLNHIKDTARYKSDPARRKFEKDLADVNARIDATWRSQHQDIETRIRLSLQQDRPITDGQQAQEGRRKTIPELRAMVATLELRQRAITEGLSKTKFETERSNTDTIRAQLLQNRIEVLAQDEQAVRQKIDELKFRGDQNVNKTKQEFTAAIPKVPSDSKRIKLMAAVPAVVLVALVGLFSLFEIKAERVGDPDSLSSRVQSEVYSLPPIPMSRSQRRLGSNGDDNIDRFIQRLDHLRFAICGDHPDVGLGRCVLISSAVGGEGKTTLAAQLAARCGHAGHSTLLIDADLRRGALCPLLDVPEGLGLNDVLTRDDLNVEDVVIPVQAGTFHLLCAGSPTSDTSRVFQGRSFGMLIARLRQLYDLIIIDSPPILPVPDALIMGRWTDGVVLASRYDVSRAPQVERARRQLDLAGIPVLGTVINGMRSSDSYYGRYTYSRQSSTTVDQGEVGDATPTG